MRPGLQLILGATVFAITLQSVAAVRVALMDFSTDDNNYRSMQRAADFTSLLQTRLQGESDVEWVERAQLERARHELELSAMGMLSAGHPIRLGRWVKADWMITGHFSKDDKNRRILSLEVIDLRHADLIASNTVVLPDIKIAQIQPEKEWINLAVENIRHLLSESKMRQRNAAWKVRIALLFLANTHRFGGGIHMRETLGTLGQSLSDAFRSAVATNDRIWLIRFPKAYRSLEESELVLEGLVEADPAAWQQVADLYVWGEYYGISKPVAGKRVYRIIVRLHLWDGVSVPKSIEEEIPCAPDGRVSSVELLERVNRLVSFVITNAHKRTAQGDFREIRREIANSVLRSYDQMTLLPSGSRDSIGWYDADRFESAVRMLETACFFDPDNAKARLLYISTRWEPRIGHPSKVEFWSKWRCSIAWAKYVNRFGLAPPPVQLLFPQHPNDDVCEPYVQSVEDFLGTFPQWYPNEWTEGGKKLPPIIDFTLAQAELRGFPSEIPLDLAYKWRKEVEAECWRRITHVAEFITAGHWQPKNSRSWWFLSSMLRRILNADQPPSARLALLEKIWPACIEYAKKHEHDPIFMLDGLFSLLEQPVRELCEQAGKPDRAAQLLAMIPRKQPPEEATPAGNIPRTLPSCAPVLGIGPYPEWLGDTRAFLSMFSLYPPNPALPKIKPPVQKFSFPPHFDVQAVSQIGFLNGKLLLVATDQRLALSTDPNADVSSETVPERSRLWVLEPGASGPTLFEPALFTKNVRQFLIEDNRLWVCGEAVGYMDLKLRGFRKQTLSDGYDLQSAEGITRVNHDIFTASGFSLRRFDTQQNRWHVLELPPGSFRSSSVSPCLFAGNKDWLCYVVGTIVFYNARNKGWVFLAPEETLPRIGNVTCVTSSDLLEIGVLLCIGADESSFWFGGYDGLCVCVPNTGRFQAWQSPKFIYGPMSISMISFSSPNPSAELSNRVQHTMKKVLAERIRVYATTRVTSPTSDPLNLRWRIPGSVTALAHDGDFLWFGTENYWGAHLLMLHKPTLRLVGCCEMNLRGKISSLAVSGTDVWIGTTDSDNLLLRLPKAPFLAIPQDRWVPFAISDEERATIIRGMSKRDQAMYAFYARDDHSVVSLLGDIDPQKASIEEMFILAYSYASTNVNRFDLAKVWLERIMARYPDSPWSEVARAAIVDCELRQLEQEVKGLESRKFDRNGDGSIDEAERAAMETDLRRPGDQDELAQKRLLLELERIVRRYDHNNDRALDLPELERLRQTIDVYLKADRDMPQLRVRIRFLNPLLSDKLPAASVMLETYDTNKDGKLDAAELSVLAGKLKRN